MHNKFCTLALSGFLALGLAGTAAFAQDQTATPSDQNQMGQTSNSSTNHHMWRNHRMNANRQLKRMTKQLNLTQEQQTQIKPILQSEHQQMQELRQNKAESKMDRNQKMMSIRQDTSSKIEAVLNDTQKQKYESMQSKMRERGMHHHNMNQMNHQNDQMNQMGHQNNGQTTPQESTSGSPKS